MKKVLILFLITQYGLSGYIKAADNDQNGAITQEMDVEPVADLPANATTLEISLPEGNPTGLSTATLNLEDEEVFTYETFRELVDKTGTGRFVIGFTQDAKGKWFSTFFDAVEFQDYRARQGNKIKDPNSQQLIQYIIPMVTINKQDANKQDAGASVEDTLKDEEYARDYEEFLKARKELLRKEQEEKDEAFARTLQ